MNRNVAVSIDPPPLLHTGLECRALLEAASSIAQLALAPRRAANERGDVLVVPGFATTDTSTWLLRRRLEQDGWRVHAWGLGCNRGPRGRVVARLAQRVRRIARESGRPVHLVGWSLGGVLARIVAGRAPASVGRVVALGSPLSGERACSRLTPLVELACGRSLRDRHVRRALRHAARVPVVSIYSRSDGVVAWRASAVPGCTAIEVDCSHLGLVLKPEVLDQVAIALRAPGARRSGRALA